MFSITAKIREKKSKTLKKGNRILAVLYGPKLKNLNLSVDLKEFNKVLDNAGESSLIELKVDDKKEKFLVLIHDVQFSPIKRKAIHVDFYQPALDEEIEVTVPIVIEGESLAVKSMGGTLVRNISEIEVRALPQKLPKEIKVSIANLKSFEDYVLVKDLQVPEGVKILRELTEILISVSAPEKEEEKLKPAVAEEKKEEKEGEEKKEEPEEKTE